MYIPHIITWCIYNIIINKDVEMVQHQYCTINKLNGPKSLGYRVIYECYKHGSTKIVYVNHVQ